MLLTPPGIKENDYAVERRSIGHAKQKPGAPPRWGFWSNTAPFFVFLVPVVDVIEGGFYLKARRTKDSAIAKAPPHVREIWDYMLANAFFKDGESLKRGQLLASYAQIIDGLSWYIGFRRMSYTVAQCETAIKVLTKHGMITTMRTTRGLIVTICNYDKYQAPKNYENHNEDGTRTTPIEKKEKNGKKKDIVGELAPTLCLESSKKKVNGVPYAKIVDALNERCGTKFKATTAATQRLIRARWNEGFRFDQFAAVISAKSSEWASDPKMCGYLRPETLFGPKFEGYLQAASNQSSPQIGKSCSTCQHQTNPLCQRKTDAERQTCTGWRSK